MTVKETFANFQGRVSALKFANETPGDMTGILTELMDTLKTWVTKIEELTGQKQVAEDAAVEAQAALNKINTEKSEAEKNLFFETAIKEGQLEIAELEDWKAQFDVSKEFVVKMIGMRPKKSSGQMSMSKISTSSKLAKDDYLVMDKQGFRNADGTYDEARYIRDVLGN
jgi:hypothetical protein